jgi:hypothetical protein
MIEDKDRLSVDQLSVRRVSEISHIYQLREISGIGKSAKFVKISQNKFGKKAFQLHNFCSKYSHINLGKRDAFVV